MEILGFILTILIGLLVGLFGGGGSILTVPVLVYLFAIPATLSTTYSLALVSITSLVAATPHIIQKSLSFKKILQFGIPSMLALYTVRSYILPAIPQTFMIFGYEIEKNVFMLLFFSILMLISGFFMIKQKKNNPDCFDCPYNHYILMIAGLIEGLITGVVGAGGGFIIVPILMIFGKLSTKQAVANSLFIIGVKSLIGFLGSHDISMLDFLFLTKILVIALVGMYFGIQLNKKLDAKQLKPIFGYFVMVMGLVILIKELIIK
ncbi:sulfite exporter TauE/SafE family protein [Flavobacterium agricola]|uniref:Probable membrane transporter protein n=1 Tax=Flavobacterium agricola TaxID=2870839 RepID=A0ABY6M1N5_9FLAO|nr:sulfite exporter TauE/SafE family protein [Flavobacterium agricola]UYW02463.1 sulfite exporter TauE/SafE family protein [Flavobacterium agricola]